MELEDTLIEDTSLIVRLSAIRQCFSFTTNQSTVLSATAYQPNEQDDAIIVQT
jgi:hypothetical protein